MEMRNKYELEFIITYNKKMYESENPNEYCIKLQKCGKYIPQNIFSLEFSKSELLDFLNPIEFILMLKETDKNFNDIWKVSMCIYGNINEDFELPKWYEECGGKVFDLQSKYNLIQQYNKENELITKN